MNLANFDVVASKVFKDPGPSECDCTVVLAKDSNSDDLGVALLFSRSGILRSRPLFQLAVDAALNASWESFYHACFGDEACPYVPQYLIEKEALIHEE